MSYTYYQPFFFIKLLFCHKYLLFQASRISSIFKIFLLFGFLVSICPFIFLFAYSVTPSNACGPFKGFSSYYAVVTTLIEVKRRGYQLFHRAITSDNHAWENEVLTFPPRIGAGRRARISFILWAKWQPSTFCWQVSTLVFQRCI